MPRVKLPKAEPRKSKIFSKTFCNRRGITTKDYKRMEVAEVMIITMSRRQLLKTLAVLGIFEVTVIALLIRFLLK